MAVRAAEPDTNKIKAPSKIKQCNVIRAVTRQLRGHFSRRNKHDEQSSYSNRLVFLCKLTDEMQSLFLVFLGGHPSPCLSAACCLATLIFNLAFTAPRLKAPLQHHVLPLTGPKDRDLQAAPACDCSCSSHTHTHTLSLFL